MSPRNQSSGPRRAARRRSHVRARQRQRHRFFRPAAELLEERIVLTNYVVLDFTPDTIANEYAVGRFADVFAAGSVNNTNRFLDYDGNNTINQDDAKIAVGKIASRVNRLLKPFRQDPNIDLVVMHTPGLTSSADPGAGERKLAEGQAAADENVYVVYIGNTRPEPDLPDLGIAHQAFAGENNEFYSYVFAGGVKSHLASGNYRWKPQAKLTSVDFTNEVAFTVAHELGHLWGLGHLIDVDSTPGNAFSPDNYHHVMNTPKYANPAAARFLNDATHRMEIGNATTGAISYQHVSAKQEVRDSLRTNAAGNFVQTTIPNATFPDVPTYLQTPSHQGGYLGADNPAPTPNSDVPTATLGQASGITVADITSSLTTGFNTLRDDYLDDFAAQLNLPDGSLPLVDADLGSLLQLDTALAAVIDSINVSGASDMSDLTQQLTTAGFTISHALTDEQFTGLDPTEPADFVRASRTYSLARILKSTAMTQNGLDAIGDLAGVNLNGQLDVMADIYFTVSFGVDTDGFYLVPGNGVLASVAVGGNLSAGAGGGTISGSAAVGVSPEVRLTTNHADGRVRLEDLVEDPPNQSFSDAVERSLTGSAAINLDFTYTVAGVTPIRFGGDWIWDLKPDLTGFALDTDSSGFDSDALLNSLADAVGSGLNALSAQSANMLRAVERIPVVGRQLDDRLLPLVTDALSYDNEFGSAQAYLAQRGLTIVSSVTPADFLAASRARICCGSAIPESSRPRIRFRSRPAAVWIIPSAASTSSWTWAAP